MLIQRPIFKSALESAIGVTIAIPPLGIAYIGLRFGFKNQLANMFWMWVEYSPLIFSAIFTAAIGAPRRFQWHLESGFLVQRAANPPSEFRIDLSRVDSYRYRLQVPYFGRYGYLRVCVPCDYSSNLENPATSPNARKINGKWVNTFSIGPLDKVEKEKLIKVIRVAMGI